MTAVELHDRMMLEFSNTLLVQNQCKKFIAKNCCKLRFFCNGFSVTKKQCTILQVHLHWPTILQNSRTILINTGKISYDTYQKQPLSGAVGVVEAAGSSPVTQTNKSPMVDKLSGFFVISFFCCLKMWYLIMNLFSLKLISLLNATVIILIDF